MTSVKITTDRKSGRLLYIFKNNTTEYYLRDEEAVRAIKRLAGKINITKLTEGNEIGCIYFDNGEIVLDFSDKRITNYLDALAPLGDKIDEFEKRQKEKVAPKVTRQNIVTRNKVVSSKYNPRSNEYKKKVKGFGSELLARIINSKNKDKVAKIAASALVVAVLATGAVSLSKGQTDNQITDLDTDAIAYVNPNEDLYKSFDQEVKYSDDTSEITNENNSTIFTAPDDFVGVEFSYNNRCDSSKAINCREKYGELITFYANMYGVDPNLAIAIATQERGEHSSVKDNGGATGLFQIQNGVWVGHEIKAYNFNTGKVDSIKVTNENIGELDSNIRFGCMILRECYEQMRGNIPATIQCYNYGYGNMVTVYQTYSLNLGYEAIDVRANTNFTDVQKELLDNQYDIGWADSGIVKIVNKNGYTIGDPNYMSHVLSYIEGSEYDITFKNKNGTDNTVTFRNNLEYTDNFGR